MVLRKSLHSIPKFSTFFQSSLIIPISSNGGVPDTTSPSNIFSVLRQSSWIPKTPKIPFTTKRSVFDVSGNNITTGLPPPPTSSPISRETVDAVLKLLDDVSSILNDFPGVDGINVPPVSNSGESFDEEGVRSIIIDIARRNRKSIGDIVELADNTIKRSKNNIDKRNSLRDEVYCHSFAGIYSLFGWKFTWELKGGRTLLSDRRGWQISKSAFNGHDLFELNALDKDLEYLENIKSLEDGVNYFLYSIRTRPENLEVLREFKVILKELITSLESLDEEIGKNKLV